MVKVCIEEMRKKKREKYVSSTCFLTVNAFATHPSQDWCLSFTIILSYSASIDTIVKPSNI